MGSQGERDWLESAFPHPDKPPLLASIIEDADNNLTSYTSYTVMTTIVSTTSTLVETTGPLYGSPLVIYDVELSFDKGDKVKIETSSGAKVFINPDLPLIMREANIRLYEVKESGLYKIRVTTGHGAERLFVNIYEISSSTLTQNLTYTTLISMTSPPETTNTTVMETLTSSLTQSKTETVNGSNTASNSTTPAVTQIAEPVPGYGPTSLSLGILLGFILLLISKKSVKYGEESSVRGTVVKAP